ncbi:MAG TPA: energy transducer TonB [Chitinophagaceae bacterium]|jgi:TonB family protein|nr:energy transducer TonB [Chitinophagaceae bacterium]
MKRIFVLILLLPLFSGAQKIKVNEYDKFIKQRRVESFPLLVKSDQQIKLSVSLRSVGSSIFLQLTGSGIGTNVIGSDDEVIFLLDNDSTVVAKSPRVQTYDYSKAVHTYNHEYLMTMADLEKLSQHKLQALRKYYTEKFDDIYIPKENTDKIKNLSALFMEELKREKVFVASPPPIPPAFPGGYDVLINFLNKNLNPPAELKAGEKKTAVVQFLVKADGSIDDIRITQSAGLTFDNELLRVLRRMPIWKPAVENGKPVDAIVTQPVTFFRGNAL